jgi:uncharacterized repeat protein (TIGR01451 family)
MSTNVTVTKTYEHNLIFIGQVICVPIEKVTNTSGVTATDVIVKLDKIPDGLTYTSSNLPRGEFDTNSRIWTIGSMSPQEELTGLLCFEVTDDSKAPFQFNFTVGLSDYCETCENPNAYCVTVKGLSLQELVDAGIVTVQPGTYDDDADAALGGVAIGQFYELSATNLYGLPDGHVKRRIV